MKTRTKFYCWIWVALFASTFPAMAKVGRDSIPTKILFPDLMEASTSSPNGILLNPRAVSFVQDYMESHSRDLLNMLDWARPYFNMMDVVLSEQGLPIELKYLAVIESRLKAQAVSWAGAVGPWQFMPGTARIYGLKVTKQHDERTDFIKSTKAAAKYLNELYKEFGDWLLVIAAYNGGPGNVYAAIRKSGSRDFWQLQRFLPNESRNHVKKFIGTHYVFERQGGVTTLTKAETVQQWQAISQVQSAHQLSEEELRAAKTMKVSGKYHSIAITNIITMELKEFERYNPNFDKIMAGPENSYELRLPPDKMEKFMASKYEILASSIEILLNGSTGMR